jgi:hypothetical protein
LANVCGVAVKADGLPPIAGEQARDLQSQLAPASKYQRFFAHKLSAYLNGIAPR